MVKAWFRRRQLVPLPSDSKAPNMDKLEKRSKFLARLLFLYNSDGQKCVFVKYPDATVSLTSDLYGSKVIVNTLF